ncbi:ATP-binding protein [Lutimonas sp.]|uniref:ATP-binding protein n=1 Tax=Lutimonas sp. TaxID=1872403 RepID=UPI003D9AE33F
MFQKNESKSLDHTTFLKFRTLYLIAIFLIAITIVVAQILIQNHLDDQLDDSRIVNVAGRQRMLSQKLVKEALLLDKARSKSHAEEITHSLEEDLSIFSKTHEDLQFDLLGIGKMKLENDRIDSLFKEIDQDQKKLVEATSGILRKFQEKDVDDSIDIQTELMQLEEVEGRFLVKMDQIVNVYDGISQDKVRALKQKEYLLLLISLGILILEILFLFRPISLYIRNVIKDLVQTKNELTEKVEKVNDLYVAKENSLQELQGLNYAINNAALFANIKEDGTVLYMSKKFIKLLSCESGYQGLSIDELILAEEKDGVSVSKLIENHRHALWTGEIKVYTQKGRKLWLEITVVPMRQVKLNKSALLLCTDITKRIESQHELVQLNEKKLQKEVGLQKAQASQIVEAQEEERKRIAKDIHDGIGQMLTALKFNIESINYESEDKFEEKIDKLKILLSDLIKEVRAVTFNLTPPELKDYGIVPTIGKLVDQLTKLTGKNIVFENRTDFNGRFDSLVETNLYRVVQEAVNNALKYAESNYILISLSHSTDKVSIVIDDDGKGFDSGLVENNEKGSGLGLFFMRERISYINGRIFINSKRDEGTRITINVDLSDKAKKEALT